MGEHSWMEAFFMEAVSEGNMCFLGRGRSRREACICFGRVFLLCGILCASEAFFRRGGGFSNINPSNDRQQFQKTKFSPHRKCPAKTF